MIRKAFTMQARPGKAGEYERRHNPIWPDLEEVLKRHGLHNYSIFLDEQTNRLFAYVDVEDEQRLNALAGEEVCHKWWKDMTELLESDAPDSPKAREVELREVFHMD